MTLTISADHDDAHLAAVLAFPRALESSVRIVSSALSEGQSHPPFLQSQQVMLRGEALRMPSRLYYNESALWRACARGGLEGAIALCLGTRHHDGFVRQECVTRLLACDAYWTVPFIVHLLGEYVVEVILPIERLLCDGVGAQYRDFVTENPAYMLTLGKRAVSYWDCYYRRQFANKDDYPGLRALAALNGK